MKKITAIFFTWQWLTKYIFSSINKNPHAQNFFVHSLAYFSPFFFFEHIRQPLKKYHHLAKSVSSLFSELFLKLTIFRDGSEHFPPFQQKKVNFKDVLLIKI